MTEKELKKLTRYQLLELLVIQTERADKLQKKVEELEARLEERNLNLSELGSIAEAAIQITGVFEASQQAADLYLNSAKKQADDILMFARRKADSIVAWAEAKAQCISRAKQDNSNLAAGKRNINDEEI